MKNCVTYVVELCSYIILNASYNVQTRENHKFTQGKDLFHLVASIGVISGSYWFLRPQKVLKS